MADILKGLEVSGAEIASAFRNFKQAPKNETKTATYKYEVKNLKDLQLANEQMEKFDKLNKQGKSKYYIGGDKLAAQAQHLEKIVKAYEKYNSNLPADRKQARGELVRWTNAYKARSDFDQSKVDKQYLDLAATIEKELNGPSGKGFKQFSQATFEELFKHIGKMLENGFQEAELTKTIAKSIKKATDEAKGATGTTDDKSVKKKEVAPKTTHTQTKTTSRTRPTPDGGTRTVSKGNETTTGAPNVGAVPNTDAANSKAKSGLKTVKAVAEETEKALNRVSAAYEPVEKILTMRTKTGGRANFDLSKMLPLPGGKDPYGGLTHSGDIEKLLKMIDASEDGEPGSREKNLKILNDFIEDKKKQLQRWITKTDKDSGWDNIHNPFDAEVFKNYNGTTVKQANEMLKKFQGYSKNIYQELANNIRVPKEMKDVKSGFLEQIKNGSMDALEAISQLEKKVQEFNTRAQQPKPKQEPITSGIVEGAKEAVKSMEEIADAYNRMMAKQNDYSRYSIRRTLSGSYTGVDKTESSRSSLYRLKEAHEAYNNSLQQNWDWEEQYQWAIKFVSLFEAYKDKGGKQQSLAPHKELYDKLKPLVGSYRDELQKVLDFKPQSAGKDKNTFAADAQKLEGYKDANTDFTNQLIADVLQGTKEYDQAMEELKAHIQQRKAEIAAEQEKNLRVNTELGKFGSGAKPILDAMGIAEGEKLPDAYADFIKKIQDESIKGEDAVKEFAKAVGYSFDEAAQKWTKIQDGASKFDTNPFKKAENAKELKRQQHLLAMINHDIDVWQTNPEGSIIDHPNLKFQANLDDLKKYKQEILELNPQLEKIADSEKKIYGNKYFEEIFEGSSAQSKEEINDIEQLINELNRLQSIYDNIKLTKDGRYKSDADQTAATDAFRKIRDIKQKLLDSGMIYHNNQWVEDVVNLEDKYKELLNLIESGDTKAISNMFDIDESDLTDLELLKNNFKEVIDVLNSAEGQSASKAKLSWWEGQLSGGRDLLNKESFIGAYRTLGISDEIINSVRAKSKPDETPASPVLSEKEKFLQDAKDILFQFGKTEADIPDEWKNFLDQLTNGSLTANDALTQLKQTLEDLSKNAPKTPTPTPTPSTGDAAKNAADGIKQEGEAAGIAAVKKEKFVNANEKAAKSAKETGEAAKEAADGINEEGNAAGNNNGATNGGNNYGNNPPPENEHTQNRRIVGTTFREPDGSWERRYSESDGRIIAIGQRYNAETDAMEDYERELTNYTQLEQNAIRVINQLTDAQIALSAAYRQGLGGTDYTRDIEQRIDMLRREQNEIMTLVDTYQRGPDFNGTPSEYSRQLFNERVSRQTRLHANAAYTKDDRQFLREWEANDRRIRSSQAFLVQQSGNISRLQDRYIDKNNIKLSKKDIEALNELRYGKDANGNIGSATNIVGGIEGWIRNHAHQNIDVDAREELKQMIENYKQTAKLAEESQKVATKLDAQTPTQARAALTKDLHGLLRDLEASKADVSNLKAEVQTLIGELEREEGKLIQGDDSSLANEKPWLKNMHARMNVAKSNYQDLQDEYNTNQKQLNEYLNIIKEAEDAKSRLNDIEASKISGKPFEDEAEALEKVKEKANEAYEAMLKISELYAKKKISDSDFKNALDMLDLSDKGSAKSREKLLAAQNRADEKETKTQLTNYSNAMNQYKSLYEKQLSGVKLNAEELQSMTNALEVIKRTEEELNVARTYGINLTKKQLDAREHLVNAQLEAQDNQNKNYTQNLIEENSLSSTATSAFNKMQSKLDNMKQQSEWRSDQQKWLDNIAELEDRLGNLKIDVQNEDELKKLLQEIDDISASAQKLSKDASMQPIASDWQAKAHADLAKWMDHNKMAAKEFKEELKELGEEIDEVGSKGGAEEWNAKFLNIQEKAAQKGLLGKSLGDRFKDQFKNTMTSLATYYLSFQDFIRYGREAITVITELDTQLTEMRKVSDESLKTLQNYQLETFDIASRVGTTASQIQASTADWMRLGEDLQEAKKSAEYSTLLLNVSEFGDINAATESLVAMSQAYQDMDKLDIIDKLNNIGNNFSISTSELAESLQRSAGTLKVAGNSLDEAIALTVAGNQVLQNPNMVGQSLRTISLRLTGTSVEDMQEAGEEIDGLISTQSKLRKTIMDITKTKDNNYKGFDILNESGNYKSTYEMLKGIAKVWHQIGEEDKKMGTNRQSLLLETIAGKTRAAAASSILDNFDTLQNVYEASLNSQGSAQQELDKYLDSINGKVAQFKNSIQEFLATAVNSEWIKAIIDFGTKAIEVITDLGKQFGTLRGAIGAVASIFLQKKGLGLLNFDKDSKKWGLGIGQNLGAGILKGLTKTEFSDEITNFISGKNLRQSLEGENGLIQSVGWDNLPAELQKYVQDNSGNKTLGNLGDALESIGKKSFDAASAFNMLKNVGLSLISTLGTMAATMVALLVVQRVAEGVYYLANRTQILIDKGKDARNAIQDMTKDVENMNAVINEVGTKANGGEKLENEADAISAIAERYTALHKGVAQGTNENAGLTNDEYQEYLDICNKIGNQFPGLISGYDNQGNAILRLGEKASDATDKIMSMYEASLLSSHVQIGNQLQDSITGANEEIKDYNDQINDFNNQLLGVTTITHKMGSGEKQKEGIRLPKDVSRNEVEKVLNDLGYELGETRWSENEYLDYFIKGIDHFSEDQILEINNALDNAFEDLDIGSKNALNMQNVSSLENKIDQAEQSKINDIKQYLSTDSTFLKLGDNFQDSILAYLDTIDPDQIGEDVEAFYQNEIINKIKDVAGDVKLQDALDEVFSLSLDSMSAVDYTTKIYDIISNAFNGDAQKAFDLFKLLGFQNIVQDFIDKRNDIISQIGDKESLSTDQLNQIMGFSTSEFDAYDYLRSTYGSEFESKLQKEAEKIRKKEGYEETANMLKYASTQKEQDYINNQLKTLETSSTFQALMKMIDDAKKAMSGGDETKKGILFDIFGDESYKTNVEGYEKNLSSLTSALETLRTEGKLTAEQMRDLQEQFPDLTDFSVSGISEKASDELSKWIGEFKSGWTDFSEEGLKQMDTYIANMIASYKNIDIIEKDAQKSVKESIANKIGTNYATAGGEREFIDQRYQTVIDALREEYGEDLNWSIVLSLQDQFTGDIQELIDRYGRYKMVWDLEVQLDNFQIQIDKISSERGVKSAAKGLSEALGKEITESFYDEDNQFSKDLIKIYENEIAIVQKQISEELAKGSSADQEYIDIGTQKIAQLRQNILGERSTIASNNQAKADLPRQRVGYERDAISREIDAIKSDMELRQTRGETIFTAENQALMSLIEQDNKKIEQDTAILQRQKAKYESSAFLHPDPQNDPGYQKILAEIAANETAMQSNLQQIEEYKKAIDDAAIQILENEGKALSHETYKSKRVIDMAGIKGQAVTSEMYDDYIADLEAGQAKAQEVQNQLIEDKNEFYREYVGEHGSDKDIEQSSIWQQYLSDLETGQATLDDFYEKLQQAREEQAHLPVDALEIEANDYNRQLDLIEQRMQSSTHRITAGDYIDAMINNSGIMENAQRRIDELYSDERASYDKTSSGYQEWLQELRGVQDELTNATEKQDEFNQSLLQFPAELIQKGIQKVEDELQHLQEEQDLKVSMGFSLTAEDYDNQIAGQQNVLEKSGRLGTVLSKLKEGIKGTKWQGTAFEDWIDEQISANQTKYTQTQRNIWDLQKTKKYDLPIKEIQQDLSNAEIAGQRLKNTFDEIARSGRDVTAEDYAPMVDNLQEQIKLTEDLARSNRVASMDLSYGPELRLEYAQAAMQAENALASLTQQQYEYEEAIKQLPITELINQVGGYTDLQREASEVQQEITEAETKHTKVSDKLYQKLIDNGDDQIDNLKEQRKEWENLQNKVALGSSKWHEYQNEIDSIDDSISEMRQNQVGWFEQMTSTVSTNAAALSSAISSAFSEMNSETGISIDTMNELQKQFSDLAGRDVSNIFYETADGMKMNVVAAENLIDAEYKLQTNNLYDAIEKQRDIIEKQGDATDENARKTVSAAEQRINAYQRELSMLQALYDQQKQQFTQYAAWQTAQQTDNAGKHYEDIQGYYQTAKELYEKGLIGTDDFQEYVKYFDQWGQGTVEAYERNKSKIERYVTEDSTGIFNLFDDLVAKGFGTYSDENGYDFNITDVKKAADALGISEEFFRDVFSRGEDYGATNDWVESELDGRMKIQEATQKQIDAQMRYNEALRNGASQEVLDEIQGEIDQYGNSITNLGENIADVTEHAGQVSASQLRAGVEDINSLIKLRNDTEDEQVKDLIDQNIKALAEEKGIILTPEVHPNVDEEAMRQEFEGYEFEIPVNPDWSRLDGSEDETLSSAATKIKENWEENKESAKSYIETLQGVDPEVLAGIDLNDHKYADGLEIYEKALDSLAETFGLDTQEAQKLVDILNQLGMLGGEELWFTKNQSLGVNVSNLRDSLSEARESGLYNYEADIDFDATILSVDELKEKLRDLYRLRNANLVEGFLGENASAELNTLIEALEKAEQTRQSVENLGQATDENGNAVTNESFLAMGKDQQLSVMAQIGVDDSQYEQFVAMVESQTIQAKIETVMSNTGKTAEQLSAMSDQELTQELINVGLDESSLEEVRGQLENMTAEVPISVKIDEDQFNTLLNPEVNTETAIGQVQEVQTAIDEVKQKDPVVIEVKHGTAMANIQQVENKLNSIPDGHANIILDGTADVNSKLDILISKIKKLTDTTHIIKIVRQTTNSSGEDKDGEVFGTAHYATGTAFSTGTAAFANGTGHDWTVGEDTDALVNEIGVESRVRNGRWEIIPGGPHVEKLKKNDIID